MKLNKKQKGFFQIFGIIFLIIVITFFINKPLSIGVGQVESTSLGVKTQTNDYVEYEFNIDIVGDEQALFLCPFSTQESSEFSVSFPYSHNNPSNGDAGFPKLIDGLVFDKYFQSSSAEAGVGGIITDNYEKGGAGVKITEKENNVECKLTKRTGTTVAMNCKGEVIYTATPEACAVSKGDSTIKVKILKQGVECLDNSYCSNEKICQLNKCVSKVIPPIEKDFYRFENNECSLIKLKESYRTEIDFNSLEDCEINIVNKTKQIFLPLIIISLIVGILLFFLFKKKK